MLEILAVFVATALGAHLFSGGFKHMATSAVDLLIREFELPYLCVRFCFFTGFLAFTACLIVRAWVTLKPNLARATSLL